MLIWNLKDRLKPAGLLFCLYLTLYSVGRFLITFLREDRIWAMGLQEAHFIAIAVLAIMVPLLVFKGRFGDADQIRNEMIEAVPQPSRAERRRTQKSD
jgi:phosphatidylglycerol:prolipoprotein diacylglycerol transferase